MSTSARRRGSAALETLFAFAAFAFVLWFLACLLNSWRDSVMDDAYITYQYGRNLAEGHGLRFNVNDASPTSGSSSLLHVALAAFAARAKLDPLVLTRALGIACVALVGGAVGVGAARATRERASLGLAVGAWISLGLATLPETVVHLASGMETMLFFALHTLFCVWSFHAATRERELGASLQAIGAALAALLAITRPEGAVLGVLGVICALAARGEIGGRGFKFELARGKWLVAACLLTVTAIALGHFAYFGVWLPNSYYVKTANRIFGAGGASLPGASSDLNFVVLRCLPFALLVAVLARASHTAARWMPRRWLVVPSLAVLLALSRTIREMAGGFRYEFPLIAPLLVGFAVALFELRQRSPAAFRGLLLAAGVCAPLLSTPARSTLANWMLHPRSVATHWLQGGPESNALAALGVDLGAAKVGSRATVLLSAAGQIPYWSRLRAIDWIGLNDDELCGRESRSLDDVWRYIDSQKPDVICSILPPAARDGAAREDDPNFRSSLVQSFLQGRASELFERWNHATVSDMFRREMSYVRAHYEFGACYKLGPNWGHDWWLFVYLRKDSNLADELRAALAKSKRIDRTSEFAEIFAFDPRGLGRTP